MKDENIYVREELVPGGILKVLSQLDKPGEYVVELADESFVVNHLEGLGAQLILEMIEKQKAAGAPVILIDLLNILRAADFWLTYVIKARAGAETLDTIKQQLQDQLDGKEKGNGVN